MAALTKLAPGGCCVRPIPRCPPRNDAAGVTKAFTQAQKKDSSAGAKVSLSELRGIVARAKVDGFSRPEKAELAKQWAMLFDGSGYRATEAAQKEFAEIRKRYDLPPFFVR